MVSISEFLSGQTYGGQKVTGGSLDPMAGRPSTGRDAWMKENIAKNKAILDGLTKTPGGGYVDADGKEYSANEVKVLKQKVEDWQNNQLHNKLQIDESDMQYNIMPMFAKLLQGAEADGGILSSQFQDARFASETAGAGQQLGMMGRERDRTAAAANLNPMFAQRMAVDDEFNALSSLIGKRNQLATDRENSLFQAQQAFTNLSASTAIAEKSMRVNVAASLKGAQLGVDAAKAGGKAAMKGAMIGAAGMVAAAFV